MNIAELQAALTAFGGLVGAGREAFLWWIAFKIIENFTVLTAIGAVIYGVVHTVKYLNPREAKETPLEMAYIAVRHLWLSGPSLNEENHAMYEKLKRRMVEEERR